MEMKKHKEKCQRKRDARGNESSRLEEAPNDVDLDQVKICQKKRCVKHRAESRSDDAQTKTSDGGSRCDSSRVARDGGEHHCKHGERREGKSRRRSEEEATVAPQRREDVRACSRSGDAESKVMKRKKKMKNADDNLTPTWQREEGALQSDREEETAKSEKKSSRKRKQTAADGGSNLEDIEPPPVQERPRKKRKRREMSIAVPDGNASSEGTVVSESCPMESPMNPEPSSSSNRKKKKTKMAKSCQSGGDQGGVIAQNTAGTRSKKHGKKKKRRDLEEGFPIEPLPTLRTENTVTNEHRQINVSHTEEVVDEVDQEMGDEEEEEEEVRHLENYDYQVKFMSKLIPGFARRVQVHINRALKYDYHRFKEFEKKGIKVRFGRFSKAEVEQLHMNVRDFIRDHGAFTDPQKLFMPSYFPAEKKLISKYRLQNNFFNYLLRGISRPMKQIFQRGITLYEGQDLKSGRYSEEELKQLTQLTRELGPNWTRISQIMQRGQKNLSVKFNLINDGSAKGVWSDGEVESLLQAMKDYLQAQQQQHNGVDQLNTDSEHTIRILQRFLYSDIPWRHVSAKVNNRNSHQCRAKWMAVLCDRLTKITPLAYGWQGDTSRIQLIQSLYNLEVEDSADIDWDGIGQKMKMPPWLLQRKLYELKLFHVPNWKNKTFGEIIDVLHDIYLPQLLKKHDIGQLSAEVQPTEVLLKHLLNAID